MKRTGEYHYAKQGSGNSAVARVRVTLDARPDVELRVGLSVSARQSPWHAGAVLGALHAAALLSLSNQLVVIEEVFGGPCDTDDLASAVAAFLATLSAYEVHIGAELLEQVDQLLLTRTLGCDPRKVQELSLD